MFIAVLAASTFVGAACRDDARATDGRADDAKSPAKNEGAAASDMCAEHGVLEAICTKCHSQLAAVFQAKGDWCAEHGLPESVCPICHPERGGRPAVKVEADDGAPADGLPVKMKDQRAAAVAGIQTDVAVERPNGPEVTAVARITYDASRVALVNARAAGVVREIRADVGSRVEKSSVLAIIESAAVGAERGRQQAARSRVEVADADARRRRDLFAQGISAQRDVQRAEQELETARAELAAAEASLAVVGSSRGAGSTYALTTPLGGVVVRRAAAVGQTVDTGPILFEVVDASSMWVDIDVPEQHASAVVIGQAVTLVVEAVPGKSFTATVDYVAPEIDARTRTARARARVDNASGALRANMYGSARIAVGGEKPSVVVPRAAVQRAKSVNVVFVEKAPGEYETRRVTLGLEEGEHVEIVKGVSAGERVVTTGSFLLKTETLKDGIGAGCCD